MNFFDKLLCAIEANQSLLYASLDPDPENLPKSYQVGKDSKSLILALDNWLQDIIALSADKVCAYKPTLGFYQALGAAGINLLEKTLATIPANIPIILDAKHSDLNTSTVFARQVFENWQVDACTLTPYAGYDHVAPFLMYPGKAVFVLCATANPSAAELQEYPNANAPWYLQVVEAAKTWGTPEQLSLEVNALSPEILARVRATAPERFILWLGDALEKPDIASILAAGLDASGEGLLVPIPAELLSPESSSNALKNWRDRINEERFNIVRESPACDVWLPDVCLIPSQPHRDLILQLYDIGCIVFGDHVQASGAIFPYYIDLRKIISLPQIFHQIVGAYAEILKDLEFDRIAGIPYGSLPTATGLALRLQRPMIFPRKEVKAHGAKRAIEGNYHAGEKIVVVDDILITGNSVMQGAEKLKVAGLKVEDIVVFIDHEQEVKKRLKENGYNAHAVLTISEIAQTLYQANRINSHELDLLLNSH